MQLTTVSTRYKREPIHLVMFWERDSNHAFTESKSAVLPLDDPKMFPRSLNFDGQCESAIGFEPMNNCFANSPLRPLEHADNIYDIGNTVSCFSSNSIERNLIKTKSPRRVAQGFV